VRARAVVGGGCAVIALLACESLGGLAESPEDSSIDASTEAPGPTTSDAPIDAVDASDGATVLGAAYRAEVLTDKPLGYWRFEDGATATTAKDETGANHGTYPIAPKLVADGIAGSHAFHVAKDSLSHVRVPGAAFGFPERAAMSVEAWVRPSAYVDYEMLVSNEPNVSPRRGWSLFLRQPARAELDWFVGPPDASGDELAKFAATFIVDGGGALRTNAWMHIVFDYDGSTSRLYVDGAFRHNESTSKPSAPSGSDLFLGCRATSLGVRDCLVDADLDEVAIYDHPLGEIRTKVHYEAGKP
jgi:hypothetical protein